MERNLVAKTRFCVHFLKLKGRGGAPQPRPIEAFKMLKPSYKIKKIKERGIMEDEWYKKG